MLTIEARVPPGTACERVGGRRCVAKAQIVRLFIVTRQITQSVLIRIRQRQLTIGDTMISSDLHASGRRIARLAAAG